ncbi:hypothetical protein F4808DRAFT_469184 [Astrocystis sublimbata]|nr:hypothetical protein F4808DRAFT_469184 [Astrocystis sublimbata]
MALSQQAKDVISELPLNDTLDFSRSRLCENVDDPRREDIASLLGALVISPTTFKLLSPDGSGNVAAKLFFVQQHVRGDSVELDHFRTLIHYVVSKSSDIDIWEAVFDIIHDLGALTPPPSSTAPTFQGTPVRSSSSRLSDSETRDIVEREFFFEIRDCTFRNVGGFCDKFFNTESWYKGQKEMLEAIITEHDGNRWKSFPSVPAEQPVWDWLRSLGDRALSDLFFQTPVSVASGTFEYKHVLIVGEQKSSHDTGRFKADFLQLTRLVRGIFIDQPTRRFVHAFTLSASIMELWVFDRSGAYSSGAFNIHDKPDTFARALVGYATMDDNAMGLDAFIEREGTHHYVTLDDATEGNKTRIRLLRPIVRQKAIVCRGTTCYETQDSNVAKFS